MDKGHAVEKEDTGGVGGKREREMYSSQVWNSQRYFNVKITIKTVVYTRNSGLGIKRILVIYYCNK